ncbi:MAG: hypothetical protein ACK47B_12005 [Armatimonadota bacterium]
MEIWLGRLVVDLIRELGLGNAQLANTTSSMDFVKGVRGLFDEEIESSLSQLDTLDQLAVSLHNIQRQLDLSINNVALTRSLDVRIAVTPGRLVFGIPELATRTFPQISGLTFAYLLDEFENLSEDQQRYVNTLVREKQLPTTFVIGSRQFGLRTQETLSAGEENKQGSEFDLVVLEDAYRTSDKYYHSFCERIIRKRLDAAGVDVYRPERLDAYFSKPLGGVSGLEERARIHVSECLGDQDERPWIIRLKDQLLQWSPGQDIGKIIEEVRFPSSPLHEKFAVLLVYRSWADGNDPLREARQFRFRIEALANGARVGDDLATTYKHYRGDLYAQLVSQLRRPQEYHGIDDFVLMSGYLPRNLLVLLKQVTRWSLFLGEHPFRGELISSKAQTEGVREASNWFLSDSKGLGRIGEETELAVRRLGGLFRDMRFADKPVEVSCSSFSTDRRGLTDRAIAVLDNAVSHSLILKVPTGRRERNTHVLQHKYQLNPMLAPLFDLSVARRGTANFTPEQLVALFDPSVDAEHFIAERTRLLARLNAPFSTPTPQPALDFSE